LNNTRICLFSYGSGLASAMFSILVNNEGIENSKDHRFTLNNILNILNQQKTILTQNRIEIQPELYDSYLNVREVNHKKPSREPVFSFNSLYPGTWYLKSIDENYRRYYERKSTLNESFDIKIAHELLKNQLYQLEK
jgi:hydroxymethylglutaryl-CoA synthase